MLRPLARMFFALQERILGRPTFRVYRELMDSQHWPRERLDDLRRRRLEETVRHAAERIPYWREVFREEGIDPNDIRTCRDVRRLPLLTKSTLRARREEMVLPAEDCTRRKLVRTSGSTNEALQFYTSSLREAHITAARMRGHRWAGIRRGDREMYFWGSPVELSKQDRLKHFRDWLINDGLTDGFNVTPEVVPDYFRHWLRWKPDVIFGYPSSFALFVSFARDHGLDLLRLRERGLRVICTTSEMLTDVDRRSIEEAFGVPVRDSYGVREGGLIGYECEHGTMHTTDEQLILETIDPETLETTDGEGELVLTNIVARAMPILRYRTGDIVTLSDEPCPCGRSLGGIKVSGGRAVDFVLTGDGKWIAGYAFIYICRSVKGIVKFQVRQKQQGRLKVLLVTNDEFPADGEGQVRSEILKRLKSPDEIVVEQIDDIQPARSGKYRPVISDPAAELRSRSGSPAESPP